MTLFTWVLNLIFASLVAQAGARPAQSNAQSDKPLVSDEIAIGYSSKACKQRYLDNPDSVHFSVQPCKQDYDVADKIEITVDKAGMDTRPGHIQISDSQKTEQRKQLLTVKIWRNGKVEKWEFPASAGDANRWANDEILREKLGKVGRRQPSSSQMKKLEKWKADEKNWLYWLSKRRTYETPEGNNFRVQRDPQYTQGHCVGRGYNYTNAPMPYSVFIKGGVAIHSTAGRSLGLPGSHGCIGLANDHARKLFCLLRQKGKSGKHARSENWKRTKIAVIQDSVPPPLPVPRPDRRGWLAQVFQSGGR